MLSRILAPAAALLLIACAGLSWRLMAQAQEIGAFRLQLDRAKQTLVAERKQREAADASLLRHQAATQAAEQRAAQLDRKLQEAKRHDPNTKDWAAACGTRELPCAYREWLFGTLPDDCADSAGDPRDLPAADSDTAAAWVNDGRRPRLV